MGGVSMEFYHDILENLLDKLIDYRGKTPKKTLTGVPLVTAKIVKNGTINGYTEYIAEEDYDKWMVRGFPKVGDVILTTEAPLGEVAQLKEEKVALAQRIVCLRGKDNVLDNTYLKYYLQSGKGQKSLSARESGTTVTGIKQAELRRVDIEYPAYDDQRRIASILSSLDRKIELNNKINADLEEMAQAIFKNRFVDFEPFKDGKFVDSELGMIPKGWNVGRLDEIADVVGGSTPSKAKPEYYTQKGIAWLTPKDLSNHPAVYSSRGEIDITEEGYNSTSTKLMPKGTILFTSRAPIGYISIAQNDICTNQGFKSLVPKKAGTCFLYCFLKYVTPEIENKSTGSTFKEASGSLMKSLQVIMPEQKVFEDFETIVSPLFARIESLEKENSRLSLLRDTLLPRFMSGELEVPE